MRTTVEVAPNEEVRTTVEVAPNETAAQRAAQPPMRKIIVTTNRKKSGSKHETTNAIYGKDAY